MAAWGFTYRTHLVWVKDRIGTGLGSLPESWRIQEVGALLAIEPRGRVPLCCANGAPV